MPECDDKEKQDTMRVVSGDGLLSLSVFRIKEQKK